MKKFLKNLILFILSFVLFLSALVFIDFIWVKNQYSQNYQASLIDKVERMNSIKEPKILLVGNSNVAFGFRSELIEKEIGMPVVNLGLHGALGNKFHENIAKLNINEGDIVVICHSDYSEGNEIVNPDLALITFEWNIELWPIADTNDYLDLLKRFPSYMLHAYMLKISNTGNRLSSNGYDRTAFNNYGDNIYANGKSSGMVFYQGVLDPHIPQISDECINRINELNNEITKKGASLVVAGYPIANGEYTSDKAIYLNVEKELRERLECPLISSFEDYFFDYKYFFDTVFHLTEEGAVLRTNQLIKDLNIYLKLND